ncbi:hypothetical protein TPAR_00490 [Tolypocladium paradoxum]|uniref:Uncharacterized protein n=1 Tax=Tolypocladium paradoxum TaxID=94208 RepID=A0A2S4LA63_9HYPO|nr:hypothetical protein TPAR_00490 [Tolypocladium paradoxum]
MCPRTPNQSDATPCCPFYVADPAAVPEPAMRSTILAFPSARFTRSSKSCTASSVFSVARVSGSTSAYIILTLRSSRALRRRLWRDPVGPDDGLAGQAPALEELVEALLHAKRAALDAAGRGAVFEALLVALLEEAVLEVEDVVEGVLGHGGRRRRYVFDLHG